MGFARITCGMCQGFRTIVGETCTNCNGEGTIVIHTGQIKPTGSVNISIDPAGPSMDESWAVTWERMDDGSLNIIDMKKVEDMKLKEQTCEVCHGSKIEEIPTGHGTITEVKCGRCEGTGSVFVPDESADDEA